MKTKIIDVALQGGGSHGAFTWGVLDRLLEEEAIEIEGISGASAGAMNAVVLAAGLLDSGREGARAALRSFWTRVSDAARNPWGPFAAFFGNWGRESPFHLYFDMMSRMFSPFRAQPFNLNPLSEILERAVDFDRLRAGGRPRLFISATSVRTGNLRVFRRHELRADMVLASACLPMVFRTVEIDGEGYWDGGYTANPALLPLIAESPAHDLLVVQINPLESEALPAHLPDILSRINQISFNASLVKDLRMVGLIKELLEAEDEPAHAFRNPLFHQLDALRLHHIHAETLLSGFGAHSKFNVAWAFLSHLHEVGRGVADAWLNHNLRHVGSRSTLDLSQFR